ncbi:glycoside hydrolase family 88 protein [Actinomadura madurae]|uniref:glycoside hydrolase family 88 protein n=1 Tax=Actinomadura madurae TaxID=1993 RepID=UPI002026B9C2|nr:glycoside hydrolase family 88 protein [Actinomadura madurae]MCP9953874.1 glycoside hydrolase family 88 protein [Actinomadura madurae]MCP9970624.1 glycoside hydrolase family 88 protein [Actinomadura madurae]MCP9983094.1 glycoside hydrolase family 88 protein [Actinomadura madurae]MCQ0005347.1 glycoside hydrolase family 88 protein [Actinomadura madurae]MCQ0019340.1 glycoside hydrolase family 88 protein [Actinomadura madurae]
MQEQEEDTVEATYMHSPGRPEDLPAPEILWSRAALFALLELAPSRGTKDASVELDRRGLCYVGPAPYRSWRIAVAPGDEALLCGLADEDENTRKPDRSGFEILDLLAGLPERWNSPELRTEVDGRHYSFVYWHTSGEWHRSPYPEHIWDDGLAACFGDWLHLFGDPEIFFHEDDDPLLIQFFTHAVESRIHPDEVTGAFRRLWPESKDSDITAATRFAAGAGLLQGTVPPHYGQDPYSAA